VLVGLVGYAPKQKAYRVWLRGTHKVIVSRDVKIVESKPKQQTVKIAGTDDERDGSMNDSQSNDKWQSDLQLSSNDEDRLINSKSTNNISIRTCSKSKEDETDNIANRTRSRTTLNMATTARAFLADAVIPTTVEEAKSGHNKESVGVSNKE